MKGHQGYFDTSSSVHTETKFIQNDKSIVQRNSNISILFLKSCCNLQMGVFY